MTKLTSLSLLGAVALFSIGCGDPSPGAVPAADSGVAQDSESGSPDSPLDTAPDVSMAPAVASYTATITGLTVRGTDTPIDSRSKGWSGRIDIERRGDCVYAVLMPLFADPKLLSAVSCGFGPTHTLVAKDNRGQSLDLLPLDERYRELTIVLGADGRAVSGVMHGQDGLTAVDATIAFENDTTAPRFRGWNEGVAGITLPWDQRFYESSELLEGEASANELLGPALGPYVTAWPILSPSRFDGDTFHPKSGDMRHRGIAFVPHDWDPKSFLIAKPLSPPRDFAGNEAEIGGGMQFTDPVAVSVLSGDAVTFGESPITTWGETTIVTTGCKTAARCLRIGPHKTKRHCPEGSKGGVALRFEGHGTVTATMRAIARPLSTSSDVLPSSIAAYMAVPEHGRRVRADTFLAWNVIGGAGDTDWQILKKTSSTLEPEVGLVISASGEGKPSECESLASEFEVTMWIDQISIER